jgi:hypothetical protein
MRKRKDQFHWRSLPTIKIICFKDKRIRSSHLLKNLRSNGYFRKIDHRNDIEKDILDYLVFISYL